MPAPRPTAMPSPAPTAPPIPSPSALPTAAPTVLPIPSPSALPIAAPTALPTPSPTSAPTQVCEFYQAACGLCDCASAAAAPRTYAMRPPAVSDAAQSAARTPWAAYELAAGSAYFDAGHATVVGLALRVTWKDQGWGDYAGRLYVQLLDEAGDEVQQANYRYVADAADPRARAWQARAWTYGERDALVAAFRPGYSYKLSYVVGAGGGHALYVRDASFEVTTGAPGSGARAAPAMLTTDHEDRGGAAAWVPSAAGVAVRDDCDYAADYGTDRDDGACDFSTEADALDLANVTAARAKAEKEARAKAADGAFKAARS